METAPINREQSFYDYIKTLSRERDDVFHQSDAERFAQEVRGLLRSDLWNAAYHVTAERPFKDSPLSVYIDQTIPVLLTEEILKNHIEDEQDILRKALIRYRTYRSMTAHLLYRTTKTAIDSLPPCSVQTIGKTIQIHAERLYARLHTAKTENMPEIDDYLDEEVLRDPTKKNKLLFHVHRECIRSFTTIQRNIIEPLIIGRNTNILDLNVPLEQSRLWPDASEFYPTILYNADAYSTCPGMGYAYALFRLTFEKALPYWLSGGQER